MSKHTPGPWVYRPSNNGHFIACAGENHGYLAEVRHCRTAQDVKADACLIAKAPDLLEALQMYRAVVGNTGYALSRESAAELYAKASEVIAKATGEPE